MAGHTAGARFLHIPYKDWNGTDAQSTQEKQNYDEIERWSQRLPKGVLFAGQQNTTINLPAPGTGVDIVSSSTIVLEVGRAYRVSAQWPGLTTGTAGDQFTIWIALEGQPGSMPAGNFAVNTLFKQVMAANLTSEGGTIFAWVIPKRGSFTGPFRISLVIALSPGSGGPGSVFSQQTSGSNEVPSLVVEDLGALY